MKRVKEFIHGSLQALTFWYFLVQAKSTKKKIIINITKNMNLIKSGYLLLFCTLNVLHADDLCIATADHFFANRNYNKAITEYMRYIYFNQKDVEKNSNQEELGETMYKMALCYRNLNQWSKAIYTISQSLVYTNNDSIRESRKLAIAIIRIASKNYSAAEIGLLRLIYFSKIESIKRKAHFFLGVCYLYQFKWQEANKQFDAYYSDQPNILYFKLDSLLYQAEILKYKSPGIAKLLSTFIPGSGQLYTGDIKNGINALVINLLTGYLVIDALVDNRFQDLFVSHISLFWRFYQGNRMNSERIAQSYNDNLKQETAQKILNYLEVNCE